MPLPNKKLSILSKKELSISEATLQKKILKYLKQNNFYYFKVVRSSRSGTPDIIALKEGFFYAIEVKSEKGRLSDLQKIHKKEIKQKKGRYYEVRPSNFEEFKVSILS